MPNSLQDAIASIVYGKIINSPKKFPKSLVSAVMFHADFWGKDGKGQSCEISDRWRDFVKELEKYSDILPEFL